MDCFPLVCRRSIVTSPARTTCVSRAVQCHCTLQQTAHWSYNSRPCLVTLVHAICLDAWPDLSSYINKGLSFFTVLALMFKLEVGQEIFGGEYFEKQPMETNKTNLKFSVFVPSVRKHWIKFVVFGKKNWKVLLFLIFNWKMTAIW